MKNASLNYDVKNLPTPFLSCLVVFLSFLLPFWIAGLVLRDAFLSWLCWTFTLIWEKTRLAQKAVQPSIMNRAFWYLVSQHHSRKYFTT
jgi:hypothetical protein